MQSLASDNYFKFIFNNSSDAILCINNNENNQKIIDLNNQAQLLFLLSKKEALNLELKDLLPELSNKLNSIKQVIKNYNFGETKIKNFSGKILSVEINLAINLENNLIIIYIRDITYKKLIEQQKQELEYQINQNQKIQAIGEKTSKIAHDFNNFLMIISGYLELIKNKILRDENKLNKPNKRFEQNNNYYFLNKINYIESTIFKANNLIKEILISVTQKNGNNDEINKENLELISVFELLKDTQRIVLVNLPKNIDLILNSNFKLPEILGSFNKLQNALINLINNSIYAILENQKNKNITQGLIKLNTFINEEKKNLSIIVEDNGIGIKKENLNRIFEPFFTTKSQGIGTGLGLANLYNLMKSFNGNVEVKTEINKGTNFILNFPFKLNNLEESLKKTKNKEIIYLDDDENLLFLIKRSFKKYDLQIKTFSDYKKLIQELSNSSKNYEFLITDYNMPNLTGIDLVKMIKINNLNNNLKIILTSGFVTENIKFESKELNIFKVLEKTPNINDFIEELLTLINQ